MTKPSELPRIQLDSPTISDTYMTVAEIATMLRVSKMSIYRVIEAGELPALRVGRAYRVRESDLQAYIDAGGSAA